MKIEKVEKIWANLLEVCYTHKYFKTSNKSWIKLRKVYRVIKFNQKVWLIQYIDMNTELRRKSKNDFAKHFFKVINNASFWKNHVKCEKTQRYQTFNNWSKKKLFSIKGKLSNKLCFSGNLLAIKIKKKKHTNIQIFYVGLSILDISKIVMYEF